jgi:hypothetical protein
MIEGQGLMKPFLLFNYSSIVATHSKMERKAVPHDDAEQPIT